MSGQITVGRAGRHVRYSEVMSGSVDTFNLGRTKQSRVDRRSSRAGLVPLEAPPAHAGRHEAWLRNHVGIGF